jgi:hypothetical protein
MVVVCVGQQSGLLGRVMSREVKVRIGSPPVKGYRRGCGGRVAITVRGVVVVSVVCMLAAAVLGGYRAGHCG